MYFFKDLRFWLSSFKRFTEILVKIYFCDESLKLQKVHEPKC